MLSLTVINLRKVDTTVRELRILNVVKLPVVDSIWSDVGFLLRDVKHDVVDLLNTLRETEHVGFDLSKFIGNVDVAVEHVWTF